MTHGIDLLPEPTDTEGTKITVGARVAYNLSGEVVRGVVVGVGAPRRINQWYVKHSIKVRGPQGQISHVRNNRSVLVLG